MNLDLTVVMPVYNEEACIVTVIRSWMSVLDKLSVSYEMIILNDGSRDQTEKMLYEFQADKKIRVINKPNTGHGPTILMGYKIAVEQSDWVFQCDSDNEMSPEYFPKFWENRKNKEAVFAIRTSRIQNKSRKLISAVSRATVFRLFGKMISDVNVPYRLIRSDVLALFIYQIPQNIFAPNIIISGVLSGAGIRISEIPVPHENRQTGTASIIRLKLWQSAMKSFWQTLTCRPQIIR